MMEQKLDSPLCPHCIAEIDPSDHLCPHCGGPVSAHASIDPTSQGRAYQNAIARPQRIHLTGMWLIFGLPVPLLVFFVVIILWNLIAPGGTYHSRNGWSMTPISQGVPMELGKLIVIGGLLTLFLSILWKVTKRYIQIQTGVARGCPVRPVSTKGAETDRFEARRDM